MPDAKRLTPVANTGIPGKRLELEVPATLTNTVESAVLFGYHWNRRSTRHVVSVPDGRHLVGFRIDFELFSAVCVLAKEERTTLRNLISKTEVVDEWLEEFADGVDLAVFKPVIDNDSFVALDDN